MFDIIIKLMSIVRYFFMIAAFKTTLSIFLVILDFMTGCLFGNFTSDYSPKEDDCRLSFAAISDCHITTSNVRAKLLELGLYDMENAETRLDAMVFCGDNTDHGYDEQYELLVDTVKKHNPAENIIMAVGNHDTWTRNKNYDEGGFKDLFKKYSEQITGRSIDNVYYSTKVNGYTFIVMGSEEDHTYAYFSPEQLSWLRSEMDKASRDGLPIFVISHWPINETHGLPETWGDKNPEPDDGGMGDQSAEVEAILKSYNNVFLISGHVHDGFSNERDSAVYGYESVESEGSFHSVNLPSYTTGGIRGRIAAGTGYSFEVYADKVIIRARSFTSSIWYTNYDYTFELV